MDPLAPQDGFVERHIGPSEADQARMLAALGYDSLDALVADTVPSEIALHGGLALEPGLSEREALEELAGLMGANRPLRSLIGQGYSDCITPPVIQRNILESPGWYTQYTPYQAEIAQGRLEALFVFQTMIADLTALPLANASLLDEATAAAEAMAMCRAAHRGRRAVFWVAQDCHPQTIAVVQTRAEPLGIEVLVGDRDAAAFGPDVFGVLLQSPTTDGRVVDHTDLCRRAHDAGALVVIAADLLALTLIRPPGAIGADIAVGSCQRFGVPLGFGGPHAGYLATTERHKRQLPGRIVGLSKDAAGAPAYRLALQTREQHIRRQRATSNICTAQVLLAIMAGMYAVYHGAEGLLRVARRVRRLTATLAAGLRRLGVRMDGGPRFDTLTLHPPDPQTLHRRAVEAGINLRRYADGRVGVSLDERSTPAEITRLWALFGEAPPTPPAEIDDTYPDELARRAPFLQHEVFEIYRTEHEMLRYLTRLQSRDLSLTTSMIPLGSCTMKLNGTAEMLPVTWPEIAHMHPFAPLEQAQGYRALFEQLEGWLAEITGMHSVSLQPNAGAQGEYAGLLAIRAWHRGRGEGHRDVCLIPASAHGTNPASAVMAGFRVVGVACDSGGDIDLADLRTQVERHAETLGALMITYPSTHGVFEEGVQAACEIVHAKGGQVYLDGANMNAQVGLCRPGDYGADVCHLNLHKTFAIPHGGGGPGVGPIAVAAHLAPYLPSHPTQPVGGARAIGPVAAAPWGSAGVLCISWMYIRLMGGSGLRLASQVAILNANYMAHRLGAHLPILYTGARGRVAHEFILDVRPLKQRAGVTVDDVAKRLMDFGFHAPTMSFPVPGTLMIEPTESETRRALDRFCEAMIAICEEARSIEAGTWEVGDSPLRHAPHTAQAVTADEWTHRYSRAQAAYPAPWLREHKFWPAVGRIDNAHGDRHLICACPEAG